VILAPSSQLFAPFSLRSKVFVHASVVMFRLCVFEVSKGRLKELSCEMGVF
jgi:hypothetical protein